MEITTIERLRYRILEAIAPQSITGVAMYPGEVIIPQSEIARVVPDIARDIAADYGAYLPLFVGVMDGALCFLADLVRAFPVPVDVATARVSSYRGSESGEAVIEWLPPTEVVRGRDVLLVEDILDTGKTVSLLIPRLIERGAESVGVCALLNKPARRSHDVEANYAGFDIPDIFVIGYGLDYNGAYRNLPDVRELAG